MQRPRPLLIWLLTLVVLFTASVVIGFAIYRPAPWFLPIASATFAGAIIGVVIRFKRRLR
jgi:hypothetical protein